MMFSLRLELPGMRGVSLPAGASFLWLLTLWSLRVLPPCPGLFS